MATATIYLSLYMYAYGIRAYKKAKYLLIEKSFTDKKIRDTVFLESEFASLTYANLIFFHFYDWNGKDSILK